MGPPKTGHAPRYTASGEKSSSSSTSALPKLNLQVNFTSNKDPSPPPSGAPNHNHHHRLEEVDPDLLDATESVDLSTDLAQFMGSQNLMWSSLEGSSGGGGGGSGGGGGTTPPRGGGSPTNLRVSSLSPVPVKLGGGPE